METHTLAIAVLAAFQIGAILYALVMLTRIAGSTARQSESLERIAQSMQHTGNSER